MFANKLKLNPEKTEFILIGSKNSRKQLHPHFPINILGNQVSPAQSVFMEWSSTSYPQCSKSLVFQKSTKNLPISEIISTLASNYRTPDRLPGYDLEHV